MINFNEKQQELITSVKRVFEEKKELCKKNNKVSSYIDPDFFDIEESEDKIVCEQVQKRLDILCEKIKQNIVENFADEENKIAFQVFKNLQVPYESICYLHGYVLNEDENYKLKMGKIPKYIQNKFSFFMIVDTKNGPSLLPWRV